MTTKQINRSITITFENDGTTIRTTQAEVERIETDETGVVTNVRHIGRKKLTEVELAAAVPSGALLAQISSLQDQLKSEQDGHAADNAKAKADADAATTALAAMTSERDTLKPIAEQVPVLTSERDAAVAERDALQAQIAQLTATPSVPESISDRQFASELRHRGIITLDESLDYLGRGEIPAQLLGLIDQIADPIEHDSTLELVTGATVFVFDNPASIKIGQLFGWSEEQRREFWIEAGKR
jgi:hypothetical protein